MKRTVRAGSALGPGPNPALQRIAARWRMLLNLKSRGWAARAEGCRLARTGSLGRDQNAKRAVEIRDS
jgi:hypothetical protein